MKNSTQRVKGSKDQRPTLCPFDPLILCVFHTPMATIYVENQPYQAEDGQNLLHACLSLGFDLPYFCWHPALGSVGACRQCAVKQFKDEKDTQGKLVMACMTPAADGAQSRSKISKRGSFALA